MRQWLGVAAILFFLQGMALGAGLDPFAKAMGADKVGSIDFGGSGFQYAVGQSFEPRKPWPKFNLETFRAVVNYSTASMTEERALTQWEKPPRGGGWQPISGVQIGSGGISLDRAWTSSGGRAVPSRSAAAAYLALWTTPHGVVKATQAVKATVKLRTSGGRPYETVSFGKKGAFSAIAWFDAVYKVLVAVEADVADPVLGDKRVVTLYSAYKDFDGIKFPTRITEKTEGFPSFELNVTSIRPNAPADIKTPRGLGALGDNAKVEEVASGIFFITGGSHNSVAIAMDDHVVLFEAPLDDARMDAVVKAVSEAVPGKEIRTVVNTHHHFDHSGGLRAMAARGSAIVTGRINVPFFGRAFARAARISPDALARSGKKAEFIAVDEKHVLTDGRRRIELYRLSGNLHDDGLLIGHLPAEKVLMVADAFNAGSLLKGPQAEVNPLTANLWENL
ncbi:MAG TPA: MBL fold metallo-hydrolase, partial [Candidatus Binatia bacterium]